MVDAPRAGGVGASLAENAGTDYGVVLPEVALPCDKGLSQQPIPCSWFGIRDDMSEEVAVQSQRQRRCENHFAAFWFGNPLQESLDGLVNDVCSRPGNIVNRAWVGIGKESEQQRQTHRQAHDRVDDLQVAHATGREQVTSLMLSENVQGYVHYGWPERPPFSLPKLVPARQNNDDVKG